MSTFEIRTAIIDDLPAITAIYEAEVRTGTATFELEPPDLAEMTARFEKLREGGFPYLVAVRDGVVQGYAYATHYRPRPAYRFTIENSVYFAESARRQGMGLSLLNELIAQCERNNHRQMVAVIGDSTNAGSIGLHTRAGFKLIGTHPNVGYKFGRWLDTVMMQRSLGDGGNSDPA